MGDLIEGPFGDPLSMYRRAAVLDETPDGYERAAILYIALIRREVYVCEAAINLGRIYYLQGRSDDARRLYEYACLHAGRNLQHKLVAMYNLGFVDGHNEAVK